MSQNCKNCRKNEIYRKDVCFKCFNDLTTVQPYMHKPKIKFFGRNHSVFGKLLFGVEIEVENFTGLSHSEILEEIIPERKKDLFVVKRDGSLRRGMEFVTMPMGFALATDIKKTWSWTKKLADLGVRSHDTQTCGMHIHVNRDNMSVDDIRKINYFVNQQRTMLEKLGRRPANTYCSFDPQATFRSFDWRRDDRYKALNLTNSDTIEFRFMKGTLNADTIVASIQLIAAIIEFCKNHNEDYFNCEGESYVKADFLRFVKNGGQHYGKLRKYMSYRKNRFGMVL